MNRETHRELVNLYINMMDKHLCYHSDSMPLDHSDDQRHLDNQRHIAKLRSDRYETYGRALDQIRSEIKEQGYNRIHRRDLGVILRFLKELSDSELSEALQRIINSLGSPEHI